MNKTSSFKHTLKSYFPLFPVCFLIALVWLAAEGFRQDNSVNSLFSTPGHTVLSVCYAAAVTLLLSAFGIFLDRFFCSRRDIRLPDGRLSRCCKKHPFAFPFFALLLCWSWQLLLSYPGQLCLDSLPQLLQFFGYRTFTAHHPPAHTCLIGLFVKFGVFLGSGNAGLFLFVLFQAVVFAAALSRMFCVMRAINAPVWLRLSSFCVAAVSPYYATYTGIVIKDNLYSYAVLLFVTELVCLLCTGASYWKRKCSVLLLSLSIIGSILMRNNGIYVIYPTVLVLFVLLLFALHRKKYSAKTAAAAILAVVAPILLANTAQSFLMQHYHIQENSVREALSLPFQQTARYVKEYGDEVTKEEKRAINRVLRYRLLADRYDPKISDPVKNTFRESCTRQDVLNYLKVWLKQGLKHPGVYLQATLNQNYYLLYPMIPNITIYNQTVYQNPAYGGFYEETGIHEVQWIQFLDRARTVLCKAIFSLPVVGQLLGVPVCVILLVFLCCFALMKKRFLFLAAALPSALSCAIIVLAPVIQGHARYAFPIVYAAPVVLAFYLHQTAGASGASLS